MERQQTFIPEIESLRGIAAMTVLVGHCYVFGPGWAKPTDFWHLVLQGPLDPQPPVILFFVMSGMVLGLQLRSDVPKTITGYIAYMVRRLFRIVPAMWVAILLSFILLYGHSSQPTINWERIFNSLTLRDFSINAALWSLQVELICSVVFPAVYWAHIRIGALGNAVLFLVLFAATFIPGTPLFLQFLICFHVGALILASPRKPIHLTIFAAGLVGYIWAPEIVLGYGKIWKMEFIIDWAWLELPSCFVVLLYVANTTRGLIFKVLNSRSVAFIGRISYSIYLIHLPILLTSRTALELISPSLFASSWCWIVITAATLAITIPLAALLYCTVERPFLRLGKAYAAFLIQQPPQPLCVTSTS